jgi:ATP-dependent DNA helicase RecG
VLVGTHAVFQKDVVFPICAWPWSTNSTALAWRSGWSWVPRGQAADVLVMTATPIPRSLALASYGDMDVSVLDEKPPGASRSRTALVSSAGRMDEVVGAPGRAIAEGRQAYWVCPLVEESELVDLTSAEERFAALRAALGEGGWGWSMARCRRPKRMPRWRAFVAGETSVLVATTVIEVGVNVPNATIMVIERAEIFGLAQLHQLRGRVGAGQAESTCLLMYQAAA